MKYTILCSHDPGVLKKCVNEHLNRGWQLHGNIIAYVRDKEVYFVREMVFPDSEELKHVENGK